MLNKKPGAPAHNEHTQQGGFPGTGGRTGGAVCRGGGSVGETVLRKLRYAQLHKALSLLSDDERELIDRLFFLTWGMTVQAFFALVHFHSPLYYLTFRDGI